MSDMNYRPNAEDTISMIDIFAVILRWRMLVIVITGVALIGGLLVFWALPKAKVISFDQTHSYAAQLNLKLVNVPGRIAGYFDASSSGLAQSYFSRLGMVLPVFRDVVYTNSAAYHDLFKNRGELEAYLQSDIIGSRLKTSFDGNGMVLTVSYSDLDPEIVQNFLIRLNEAVRKQIIQDMQPKIVRARQVLDDAYKSLSITALAGTQERILAISDLQQQRFVLEQLAEDPDFPYQQLGDIVVLVDNSKNDGNKTGISANVGFLITVFGAFFVSIFMAFVLDYIRRIRQNDGAMAKLKAALRK